MNEEIDLIEQARKAGQAYIDSLGGDLKAVVADLRRRSIDGGRQAVSLPAKPPPPWQLPRADKKAG